VHFDAVPRRSPCARIARPTPRRGQPAVLRGRSAVGRALWASGLLPYMLRGDPASLPLCDESPRRCARNGVVASAHWRATAHRHRRAAARRLEWEEEAVSPIARTPVVSPPISFVGYLGVKLALPEPVGSDEDERSRHGSSFVRSRPRFCVHPPTIVRSRDLARLAGARFRPARPRQGWPPASGKPITTAPGREHACA
jgi:hypothetical protein